jgi:hypothetical protein
MARYAYDVNTTQRYIDVHKQFQGGLKTVDTDDALGAVFLREAENVSISEFGFLEKRYGTYENFKQTVGINANSKLQGYWEFEGYIIYAVDGDIFVNGTQINTFHTEAGLRYPINDNIPFNVNSTCAFVNTGGAYLEPTELSSTPVTDPSTSPTCGSDVTKISCECQVFIVGEGCAQWSCQNSVGTLTFTTVDHFQRTRDMNAVNINRVLYIFTGTYPLYAKVVSEELKFYLLPVTIPTFDEIVVTGHNLLEDDYEDSYFSNTTTIQQGSLAIPSVSPVVTESAVSPRFPFQSGEGSGLEFHFRTTFPQDMNAWSSSAPTSGTYVEVKLDSVQYRTSGPGASLLDYTEADISKTNFVTKSNFVSGASYPSRGLNLITQAPFDSTKFTIAGTGSSNERAFYEVSGAFEVSRTDFLKYTTYGIEFLEFNNTSYTSFLLSQFANPPENHFKRFEITPVDFNGNILSNEKVSFAVTESNSFYRLPIPANLNKNLSINKYIVEFFVSSIEIYGVGTPQGPVDMQTSPENYSFNLFAFESKSPATTGNLITSSSIPSLNFKLSDLSIGNFDFRVTFLRERFQSVGGILVSQNKEYFETTVYNVLITPEKLQDYPGAIDYPTLKPIWTCNKVTEHFSKLMVWGSQEMPTAVFYSFPDRPSYFPSKFFLDFTNDQNSPVEAVSSYMNILVVQTRDQTWGIRGNSGLLTAPAPYAPFTINPTVGTIAYKSVRAVRNHLFFLSKQGIIALKSLYAADEQYNIEFVDRNILNIVPRDDDSAVGIQFDNQYWLNFPKQRITLRWYIDKKAWVKDTYGAWNQFNGVFKYQIVDGKLEFITYPSRFETQGNLGVYKVGVDYSLPTDLGGDIVALFETAFLNQNYPFHPKNYKETKMDFTVQNEYNSGRDPIYTMETNEDIHENESLHTIPAPKLLKNHRYQLKYDFQDFNTQIFDLGSFEDVQGGFFTDTLTETLNGGLFIQVFTSSIDGGTFVQINIDAGSFNDTASESIDAGYFERILLLNLGEKTIQTTFKNTSTLEFLLDNSDIPAGTDLVATGIFQDYNGGANLLDVTYDHVLDFRTWIISEDNTLNLDNMEGYDQSKAEIPIQLGAKFGDWVFGLSDLGNKVTAIKTIKLAGRGYNVKVYFEDYSKSKWTLESLGITYKMKRPRSR